MWTNLRFVYGLIIAFGIGFGSAWAGIAVPAPPALFGALLVVAMTVGHLAAGRFVKGAEPMHREVCGAPSGRRTTSDPGEKGVSS